MRNKFELNSIEKIEKKVLIVIALGIVLVVIIGIINQTNGIDKDYILFPVFLFLSTLFCGIYSINAFTSGNLVRNWCNKRIYDFIYDLLLKKKISEEKANTTTIKIFGGFTLLLVIICVLLFVQSFITGKW